jgi:hypothetical protein
MPGTVIIVEYDSCFLNCYSNAPVKLVDADRMLLFDKEETLFKFCVAVNYFFLIPLVGCGVQLGPLGTAATDWPIVEFTGMKIGRGNRNIRRKPVPAPLCPPQIPLDQTRNRTRAAAVGSQRLTA